MDSHGVVLVGQIILFAVLHANTPPIVFVNPLIMRIENLKVVTLSGAFIMSLGLFLASFSSRVNAILSTY